VTIEQIAAQYNAPNHPRVTSREKKAETVMNDFIQLILAKAEATQC
jgi:calcyphosin